MVGVGPGVGADIIRQRRKRADKLKKEQKVILIKSMTDDIFYSKPHINICRCLHRSNIAGQGHIYSWCPYNSCPCSKIKEKR